MNLQTKTPVPILQNEWEFEQLLKIYQDFDPVRIIEIGSFFGGTLYHWIMNADLKHIVAVDLPIGPEDGRYNQMVSSRLQWEKWIENKGITLNDIQGNSTDPKVIEKVKELTGKGYADFLFIDGDHSYEGVKADYENYKDFVRSGGMIVFHDIVGYWTVKQLWDEVKIGKKYLEICHSGPDGWGIGVLYV